MGIISNLKAKKAEQQAQAEYNKKADVWLDGYSTKTEGSRGTLISCIRNAEDSLLNLVDQCKSFVLGRPQGISSSIKRRAVEKDDHLLVLDQFIRGDSCGGDYNERTIEHYREKVVKAIIDEIKKNTPMNILTNRGVNADAKREILSPEFLDGPFRKAFAYLYKVVDDQIVQDTLLSKEFRTMILDAICNSDYEMGINEIDRCGLEVDKINNWTEKKEPGQGE